MAAMIANIAATITKAKPKLRLLVTTAEEHAPYRITPIRMNTAVRRISQRIYNWYVRERAMTD
jgi:hypothetical protein